MSYSTRWLRVPTSEADRCRRAAPAPSPRGYKPTALPFSPSKAPALRRRPGDIGISTVLFRPSAADELSGAEGDELVVAIRRRLLTELVLGRATQRTGFGQDDRRLDTPCPPSTSGRGGTRVDDSVAACGGQVMGRARQRRRCPQRTAACSGLHRLGRRGGQGGGHLDSFAYVPVHDRNARRSIEDGWTRTSSSWSTRATVVENPSTSSFVVPYGPQPPIPQRHNSG